MAPLQPYQPDLAGSFARGLQIREALEASRDRDRKRRGRDALAAGNLDEFSKLDPEGYATYAKNQREGQKAEIDMANTEQQMDERRNTATSTLQERIANSLQSDPTTAAKWQQAIDQRTRLRGAQLGDTSISPFEVPGHTLPAGQAGPQVAPTDQEIEAMRRGAGGKDLRTNDQQDFEYGQKNPAFRAYEKEKKPAGTVVNVGGTGTEASKQTRHTQETALLKANDLGAMLDQLDEIAADPSGNVNFGQFLGVVPKGKAATLNFIAGLDESLVPEDQRPWLQRANDFRATLGEYRSQEMHDLLGSAQSAREIANTVDFLLSADMNGPKFRSGYAQLRRKVSRARNVASMVLAENIPVGTPEYRKRFTEIEQQKFGDAQAPKAGAKSSAISPALLRGAAEQAADRAIQGGQAPADARQAMIDAYVAAHGGAQ